MSKIRKHRHLKCLAMWNIWKHNREVYFGKLCNKLKEKKYMCRGQMREVEQ